jgi:pimeloyl-ACP methyl ester carboxylesterase
MPFSKTLFALLFLACGFVLHAADQRKPYESSFFDESRKREIPVLIYPALTGKEATKLAVISGGNGMAPSAYGFIARTLGDRGYLVVSVQHQLPIDAPLAMSGDLYALRKPTWERGLANLRYVISILQRDYPHIDASRTILIGHSNGGDISTLFATLYPTEIAAIITFDHRRMPIPRARQPRFLSLRADEFPANLGVLPSPDEAKDLGISIVQLKNAKHVALSDQGSDELKKRISVEILKFLDESTVEAD